LNQSLQKSSDFGGDYRKRAAPSKPIFNDWAQKSINEDALDESSIHKDPESQSIMWPSAADKKDPSAFSWLNKPKEQREREIEDELDDNYENHIKESKKQAFDDRPIKQKPRADDFDERPINPKPRTEDFDERPIKPKPRVDDFDDRSIKSKPAQNDIVIFEGPKKSKTSNPVNIDDIPIPTANATQPKSFDDLL
jgi:hypothetical protein